MSTVLPVRNVVENFDFTIGRFSKLERTKFRTINFIDCFKKNDITASIVQNVLSGLHLQPSQGIASWEDSRKILIKQLTIPDQEFDEVSEFLMKILMNLEPEFLDDLIASLTELTDMDDQKLCLNRIPVEAFLNALGNLGDKLKEKIDLLSKSAQHLELMQKQDALIAKQASKPVSPKTLDNLLTAFSHFSTEHESENPWQAMQTLQIYTAFLMTPFLLSSSLEDLLKDKMPMSRLNAFLAILLLMTLVFTSMNLYQKYLQSLPTNIKPMRNFTQEASETRFDPLLARDDIIEQIFRCWAGSNRETRQHPLLVGPAGVGKSAILIEVARRIALGEVPKSLKKLLLNKKMYGGSAGLLLPSNPMFETEEKMERFIKRLEPYKNQIILAVDEVHVLFSAMYGDRCGELLKSILDTSVRGFPFFIGATTDKDYAKFIANDSARARRFYLIHVPPTNEAQTILIMREMARRHAQDMQIPDDIYKMTYQSTSSKLSKYNQPDISKRILSSAISQIRLQQQSLPSAQKLNMKRSERDNLLSQYISQNRDEESYSSKLRTLEEDILTLEKACENEAENMQKLSIVQGQINQTQQKVLKLAGKLAGQSNNEFRLKRFAFLFHYLRPYFYAERQRLEKIIQIPSLNNPYIESIVDGFILNEKNAAEKVNGAEVI